MTEHIDLRDLKFQLFDWLPTGDLVVAARYAEWDRENLEMALADAHRIAVDTLAPANQEGDRIGARLQDGRVTLPLSSGIGYRAVAEGGWIASTNNPDLGGLGMPHVAGTAVTEIFAGGNLALTLVFLLTRGVGELIEHHGTEELQANYCKELYSGNWTGTMCLAERHAGSDVGASTCRAEPLGDGRYRISGEKIFVTFGDHDLTQNVVHAVLARTPDAPAGTGGLSLFIVPKLRIDADGLLGEPNDVQCASIEHKLGIHGAPTCSILFGAKRACEGYLIGEENSGLRLMAELMNAARLEVGVQGCAVAGAAHQAALAYAGERVQGRHWAAGDDAEPVAIVEHPDVRRLLFTSGAYVQAMRALLLKTSYCMDRAAVTRGEERARYRARVEILAPIAKAWSSDWGFRVTEWCLQVFGGYGYSRDYPAEQYLRDVKITSIYEGTNAIHALDLVGRKARKHKQALGEMLAEVGETSINLVGHETLGEAGGLLAEALRATASALAVFTREDGGSELAMLNAVPFLDMMGHTLAAHYLLEQGRVANAALDKILEERGLERADEDAYRGLLEKDGNAAFFHNKVVSARHFAERALPAVSALAVPIERGELGPLEAEL